MVREISIATKVGVLSVREMLSEQVAERPLKISSFVSHHATGKEISQQPCTRLVKALRKFNGSIFF